MQTMLNVRKVKSLIGNELSTTIYKTFQPEQIVEAIETYQNNMSKGKVLIRF